MERANPLLRFMAFLITLTEVKDTPVARRKRRDENSRGPEVASKITLCYHSM
ncbi:hypothetical protein Pla22_44060 [Rubripirellula amarantea]|uniref:Uncharacterized protein n=1 Tax=Rubripirellula amarantea TaxID=2527999 RepID=A0A5C5WEP6_9BACT|nr:hypothetical protein Pla22_44060 [Rubripirellula amarantea]